MSLQVAPKFSGLISVTLLLVMFLSSALAFQCYVCDSKNDIECTENLPADSNLQPQDCHNIIGAKYCIKTTNIYAGELGTKRFCAANDHGNYCRYVKQPTGDREYRSCVLTCDSELCNGSSRLISSTYYYTTASLLILLSFLLIFPSFH